MNAEALFILRSTKPLIKHAYAAVLALYHFEEIVALKLTVKKHLPFAGEELSFSKLLLDEEGAREAPSTSSGRARRGGSCPAVD